MFDKSASLDRKRSNVKSARDRVRYGYRGVRDVAGYGRRVTGRRGLDAAPADYVRPGSNLPWTDAALREDAPPAARAVQKLVRNLHVAMQGRSGREVARLADVGHTTLLGLLRGDRWPDMATIVKLEYALEADLWPGRSPAD